MMVRSKGSGALGVLAAAVVLAACSSGTTSSATTTSTVSPGRGSLPAQGAPGPRSTIRHVAIINLENEGYDQIFGQSSAATYLSQTLRSEGALLPNYYGIGHLSADNYIAEISGQAPNPRTQADCTTYSDFVATGTAPDGQAVGQGCVYPASVKTIADQLDAAGLTWKAYQEDIGNSPTQPKTCRHPPIGAPDPTVVAHQGDQYATRHDPFVYFHSIIDSQSCARDVVGLDALAPDLSSAAGTPNLVFITPNLCHDGHDAPCVDGEPGGLTSADRFLRTWVPRLLSAPAFQHQGLLIVTFDEAGGSAVDASACCGELPGPNVAKPGVTGPGGGRTGAVVVGSSVIAGSLDPTPYNHYSLLCGLEDIFGLKHLGYAGQAGLACLPTNP